MQLGKAQIIRNAVIWFALLALFAIWLSVEANAQNSLGLGGSEQAIKPSGPFASLLFWIQQQQQEFYRSLTDVLKQIRSGSGGGWLLVAISFTYGILHAAGPGHGKAVISSYMLANEVQLRRGVALSFASSMLQATVAIVAIGLLVTVLRGLGIRQAGFTFWLEVTSYAGVTLLGLWLLWRKLASRRRSHQVVHIHSHALAHAHGHSHVHALAQTDFVESTDNHHGHSHHASGKHHDHHDHAHGICSECGHSHMPDPELLEGRFGLREAIAAIFAVGLRPCTGALIVLTFAFLNGLYWAGILSAFAMAVGTGITVSAFAIAAVGGKNIALKLSGASEASANVLWWIEVAGAAFILLLGLTLLSASLY